MTLLLAGREMNCFSSSVVSVESNFSGDTFSGNLSMSINIVFSGITFKIWRSVSDKVWSRLGDGCFGWLG